MNQKKIILALDVDKKSKALSYVKQLKNHIAVFKVGKQLFTRYGPSMVRSVQKAGGDVFLDLKFHDIPNTVFKASKEMVRLQVSLFTIHTSGGKEMMRASVEAIQQGVSTFGGVAPKVLGVTLLTSLSEKMLEEELRCRNKMKDQVCHLAALAKEAGLDGVVASPLEVRWIRKVCGPKFLIVTPGIRPSLPKKGKVLDDQKRTLSPLEAVQAGADYLVIGRPITEHKDPLEATLSIISTLKN